MVIGAHPDILMREQVKAVAKSRNITVFHTMLAYLQYQFSRSGLPGSELK